MSFTFKMSTRRRGTPGAKSSPRTRKLSITISTKTPVDLGVSGSGGASRIGGTSTKCSVSVCMSDLRGPPRFSLFDRAHVFAAFAEQSPPLPPRPRSHDDGIEPPPRLAQDLLHRGPLGPRLAVGPL